MVSNEVKEGSAFTHVKNKVDKLLSLFDINILSEGKKIQPNGKVKISIPVTLTGNPENIRVYHVDDKGKLTLIPSIISSGKVTFETDHFSLFAIVEGKVKEDIKPTVSPQTGDSSGSIFIPFLIASIIAAICGFAQLRLARKSAK